MCRQDKFENAIVNESELSYDEGLLIENLEKCLTLKEFYSDYGRDLDKKYRDRLMIFLNYKFSLLTPLQYEIADMIYRQKLSYSEISLIIHKAKSTINYHRKRIDEILRTSL